MNDFHISQRGQLVLYWISKYHEEALEYLNETIRGNVTEPEPVIKKYSIPGAVVN